jgi:anti-anti-sigma factor
MLSAMFDAPECSVRAEAADDVCTVRVTGALDQDTAPELATVLDEAARSATARTVVDLSALEFADSSALHVLLAARRAHDEAGREMVLAGPFTTGVRRLFTVTGTAEHFRLTDSSSAACDADERASDVETQ